MITAHALKPQAPAQVIWQDATPECEVGHIIRKAYAPIALVVGKEILKDGRTCLVVTFPSCRDRHTEEWVVGEVAAPAVEELVEVTEVEVAAPAASAPTHTTKTLKTLTWNQVQKLHTSLGLKATAKTRTRRDYEARILALQPQPVEIVATVTTEVAPPNRGDNGRGRVTSSLLVPTVTIASIPHATKPKADDNFMSSMVKENAFDKAFYDMTYLLEQQLKAQLAVERTVIGSEEEAIALMHLKKIDEDIEYYGRSVLEPQPSPIVVQLENQMKQLKADTLKLFKIEPFDQSILPTCDDELEQPARQSEPEPEGTIHWTTPLRGVIIGKKGATRQFYIRNDEIFIVLSGEFTASETKNPNIRHRQIREAINLGRTFSPRIFKLSPNFEHDTQVCNGGRIRQECDGRWWAWVNGGVTGHPFFDKNLATQYLDRIAANKQAQKQISCIK